MTEAGRRLLQAANEALAIAEGRADPSTYVVHRPPVIVDVREIRKGLNMTQAVFGKRFGFGVARVRDWEQARTSPAASDRVLLTTIKHAPEVVLEALRSEAIVRASATAPAGSERKAVSRSRTAAPASRKRPAAA